MVGNCRKRERRREWKNLGTRERDASLPEQPGSRKSQHLVHDGYGRVGSVADVADVLGGWIRLPTTGWRASWGRRASRVASATDTGSPSTIPIRTTLLVYLSEGVRVDSRDAE